MTETAGYDEALAETLDAEGDSGELRERLLSGGASTEDRHLAREQLDDLARRKFDLAHPVPPRETGQELEAGEIEIARAALDDDKAWSKAGEEIRERIGDALEDAPAVDSIVRLDVRISAEDE